VCLPSFARRGPADTRANMFQPLAPANGAPPDATRDPLLRNNVYGAEVLNVRKALAFAGFTHKSPRLLEYTHVDRAFEALPNNSRNQIGTVRGRSLVREAYAGGKGRAISM
jgi:protein-serine/threonine kinase